MTADRSGPGPGGRSGHRAGGPPSPDRSIPARSWSLTMAKKPDTPTTESEGQPPERPGPKTRSAAAPPPPEAATTPLPPGVRLVQVLSKHINIVHQVAWMPDGERLVSASRNGRLI